MTWFKLWFWITLVALMFGIGYYHGKFSGFSEGFEAGKRVGNEETLKSIGASLVSWDELTIED